MQKQYTLNYCNNCGKAGHSYNHCKMPITSNGIIVCKKEKQVKKYLMIRRKDSLGFIDFLRGRYPIQDRDYIQRLFNEMCEYEKKMIQELSFEELWENLWGNKMTSNNYRNEEKHAETLFKFIKEGIDINNEIYTIKKFCELSTTSWSEPEWGFPKGRREYQEKDINCALREFEEESGYKSNSIELIENVQPYDEIFIGSNLKCYKHRYFLAVCEEFIKQDTDFQVSEVGDLQWLSYEEALKIIRPYNIERINILKMVNETLDKYKTF